MLRGPAVRPGREEVRVDTFIVGVDGSETAHRAAVAAADLATKCGATLHLVTGITGRAGGEVIAGSDHWHVDSLSQGEQLLAELRTELSAPAITTAVLSGHPAKSLGEEAVRLDADMIIVGNRRVQGAARLLGSIATDVLRIAPCNVLVVHTT
ncbi:universal stress protein [soil metagenome]